MQKFYKEIDLSLSINDDEDVLATMKFLINSDNLKLIIEWAEDLLKEYKKE